EAAAATAASTPRVTDGTRDVGIGRVLLAARRVGGRRGDDAGHDVGLGSLMRHFLPAGSVTRLARGVVKPPPAAVLVPPASGAPGRPARLLAAGLETVAIAAVAVA